MSTDTRAASDCKASEPQRTTKSLLDKWTFVNTIMGDYRLTPSAKVVAVNLMWRMNCRWQTCFPKQSTISADTGLSERAVRDGVKALRERGWISWKKRASDGVYEYRFNWQSPPSHNVLKPDASELQELGAPANSAGTADQPPADPAAQPPANSAGPIEHGKDPTRERSSLSTPTASRESEHPAKPSPSAETKSSKGRTPVPAGLTKKQWEDRVWLETGPAFKSEFFPTISMAAFKKRLGETLRREKWDIPKVDRALLQTIEAMPGGDAWDYVTGILRNTHGSAARTADWSDPEHRIDYSKPAPVTGVM